MLGILLASGEFGDQNGPGFTFNATASPWPAEFGGGTVWPDDLKYESYLRGIGDHWFEWTQETKRDAGQSGRTRTRGDSGLEGTGDWRGGDGNRESGCDRFLKF